MGPPPQTEDHNAGRRAREVYRFFRPERLPPINEDESLADEYKTHSPDPSCRRGSPSIRSVHGPSSLSPSSSSASQRSRDPVWPPSERTPDSLVLGDYNVTLTSFAQLTALRLNVDRVFISVSDRDSQFIIAQAAQKSEDDHKYDSVGDGVYSGCSTLDVTSWKMCRDTVALPASNRDKGVYNFLVSNDLTQDERYQGLPFVQAKPSFRFYAGTPLTTESNINLGCFFVLDTKPRPEFTDKERELMGHMGMLIMDFLKVSRQATEGRRAARLSRGLSRFVEGNSSLFDASQSPTDDDSVPRTGTPSSARTGSDVNSVEYLNVRNSPRRRSRSSRSRSASVRSASSASERESRSDPSVPSSLDTYAPMFRPKHKQRYEDIYKGTAWTFRRAANLIRESLELEGDSGVAFVEAPHETPSDLDTGDDSSANESGKAASVLAMSTDTSPFGPDNAMPSSHPLSHLNEDFFHRLLDRHHRGKLWSFHRDGMLSSSDNERPRKSRARTRASVRPLGSRKRKTTENSILNRCFPGATQILFVPLWNSANSQWFGGFFCWNIVESNVFNPSVELSSLLGFGSSIMAECNRVESLIADRQKADFLGSISHELRSPLHGILAAAELMQSTDLNGFQGSLMETVDACGRTLLDTMNQVLDYSKIISVEREFRHLQRRKMPSSDLTNMHRSSKHLDTYTTTDISVLAEEVAEGICVGHFHGQPDAHGHSGKSHPNTTDDAQPNVDVIIDIARNDWVYQAPPGALRRIIMNIFSNAVKYTDQGNVSLHLEAKKAPETWGSQRSPNEDLVTVTVSDTGRGISEEFLRGKLYVPFAQENSLATGTGLGLSIVRSLVKSLGGSINVYSRPSDGTIVQVALPLARPEQEDSFESIRSISPPLDEKDAVLSEACRFREANRGKKVAIWGIEPENAANDDYWGVPSRYLTDWFGLDLVSSSSPGPIDVMLANLVPSEDEISRSPQGRDTPLVVLSNNYIGHNVKQIEWLSSTKFINFLNHPCGPHKLARSIQKCLNQKCPLPAAEPMPLQEQPKKPETTPADKPQVTEPQVNEQKVSSIESCDIQTTVTPAPAPIPDFKPPEPPKNDTPTRNKDPRVLIVEDNKINLNLMLAFLKKRKLTTLDSAENGQLAVDAVKSLPHSYDIIFMDISMPIMNGFEATRAIRLLEKERAEHGLPPSNIIALTGLSSARDESEALESGMDLFLTKPVTLKSITKILDDWSEKGLRGQSRQVQDV